MRLVILLVALSAAVCYAAKCPQPTNVAQKQAQMDKILSYINKPLNPAPPVIDVDKTKLKGIGILPRHEVFSVFDERMWPEAFRVLEKMLAAQSYDDFIKVAEALYSRINEDLFLYCLSIAIVHRPDAQGVHVPRVHDIYPDKFLTNDVIHKIKNKIIRGMKNPIVNDTHGHHNHYDLYNRVSYFTEDLGMNSHHYHWHVLHPSIWTSEIGRKDRDGELFFWMHRQMVARFDAELMSNHLPRIRPFENWNEPIEMGYAPHLTVQRTGYTYTFRPEGLTLKDLPKMTKSHLRQWRQRILADMHTGLVRAENGTKVPLSEERGMDTLAHMVVSTLGSINRDYYGNLHNYAHVIAARIADPKGKHKEDYGVMYDATTSARDPLFYSWHKFVDYIFNEYQRTLEPYSKNDLYWDDVILSDIHVDCHRDDDHDEIHTFWRTNTVHLEKGFDFTPKSEATVVVRHLDHEDFTYVFEVDNKAKTEKHAVFRVFLAPELDDCGHQLTVEDQRLLMIELDKFVATLKPGHNVVRRNSNESSVTMPTREIFDGVEYLVDEDHCHCGWPEYMLIPKGNYQGMRYRLFVMASDWDEDKATDDNSCHCKDATSYCGSIYDEYPDKRPMGYPFDRQVHYYNWDQFKTQNMRSIPIIVKFTGETLPEEKLH